MREKEKMKEYNIKYNIGDTVYINIPKYSIVDGIIDSFRIIENKIGIKIHYLIILNENIEIEKGVYKNFEWVDEKFIYLSRKELLKDLENIK